MSPRYVAGDGRTPPDVRLSEQQREADRLDSLAKARSDVYALEGPHSYFRDLLTLERARARTHGTFEAPHYRIGDPGPDPASEVYGAPTVLEAQQRLSRAAVQQRDISSDTGSTPDAMRPSLPGALSAIWGKAARRVSALADALPKIALERGMVDSSGTQLLVRLPALATGATVAGQDENAAVTELDPTSAGIAAPLGSLAGQVDTSRQLVDFSKPKIDGVLTDDLSVRLAENLDAQLVNGGAGAGSLRGFLQWASILSVSGVVTNAGTYLNSLWQAFSAVSGSSGYGSADRGEFLTLLHPRRAAWLQAGFAYPLDQLVPGKLVLVPNAPLNLGAGTNEDWSLVVERSAVQLIAGQPTIRVFEEVGSSTQTVRFSAHLDAALAVLNAKAVCKVVGGTPPSGF